MNPRVYSLLGVLLATACVLPDYDVVTSKDRAQSDAGSDSGPAGSTSPQLSMILPEAEPECESCAKDNCEDARKECGEDCDKFRWPVSPLWQVSAKAEPYLQCLAKSCDGQCKVLWGCTGNYVIPEAERSSVTIRVTDAVARDQELEGIRVKACQALDPACQTDVGQSSSDVTNASGRAVLTLPRSFDGHFLVEEANVSDDGPVYIPMTVTWSQPLYKVEPLLTVSLFKVAVLPALANTAETVMAGKGHLVFKAQNCLPQRFVGNKQLNADGDGVVVNYAPMSTGSRVYYTRNGVNISPPAEDTSYDGEGFGGAFNLSQGSVSVTGVHDDIEVSSAVFSVRPNHIGINFLLPRTQ